ncbi:MAG: hypothetical protein JW821_00030 [Deltaproteobacteria bacterium]|nr:hypothetical protein [Deltaproteobacteria bacterium]
MTRKARRQKKKRSDPLPAAPEQEARLRDLLGNPGGITPANIRERIPGPELASALVDALPVGGAQTADLLLLIRNAFPDKPVQKAVRKAAFRLRGRGVSLPAPDSPQDTPRPVVRREEPEAFLGPIDGTGSRPVVAALFRPAAGVDLGMGVIHDEKGIQEFLFDRYGRKRFKELKDLFLEKVGPVVGTSLSHAAALLERAHALDPAGTAPSSREYLRFRSHIGEDIPPLDRPVILQFLSTEGVSPELLTPSRIDRLIGHRLMESWIVPSDQIRPLLEELAGAEQSPILISPEQKADRINDIKQSAIATVYPEAKRALLKARLEETAYMFLKLEGEDDARACLAAALSMDRKDSALRVNPFLAALLQRSLDFYMGGADAGKSPPSSILLP